MRRLRRSIEAFPNSRRSEHRASRDQRERFASANPAHSGRAGREREGRPDQSPSLGHTRGERPASEADAKKGRESAGQTHAHAATFPFNSLRTAPVFPPMNESAEKSTETLSPARKDSSDSRVGRFPGFFGRLSGDSKDAGLERSDRAETRGGGDKLECSPPTNSSALTQRNRTIRRKNRTIIGRFNPAILPAGKPRCAPVPSARASRVPPTPRGRDGSYP
jgi:hypothetical protein